MDASSNSTNLKSTKNEADNGFPEEVTSSASVHGNPELMAAMAEISPERRVELEKKLVRKLDCILFPTLLIFYILNYIDRGALAFARLVGIEDDLNLTEEQFATCLSILYVGYTLFQVPSNLMLSKLRPQYYLPFWMAVWGVVSGLSAVVHNYEQLVTVRFFLGIVEAPFFPGAVYLISSWYTRKEMAVRCAILFGGNMLSNAFGSLIALGVTESLDGVHGLQSWRWLFIIEAAMTVGIALLSIAVVPNYPHNTAWIKGEQRTIAMYRLIEDVAEVDGFGADDDVTMWQGFKLAVRDYKTWGLVLNHTLITLGAGIVVFYPTVVGTLGFERKITYLLIAPPYLLGFATTVFGCWWTSQRSQRAEYMVGTLSITLVGLIILASSLNTGARYFSLFLVTCFMYIAYNVNLAWISNCIPRPAPKRAASIALVSMISQVGNIIAGYIYPNNQAPRYWLACTVEAISIVCAMALTISFRFILKRENRKLDEKEQREAGEAGVSGTKFRFLY